MLFGLIGTSAVSFNPLVFDQASSGNPGTIQIRVFDTANNLIASLDDVAVAGFMDPTTLIGVVAAAGESIGRINLFATSLNDMFTGADNISVYTSVSDVPLPAALPLFLAGLAGFGFAGRKRKA
jgi:hypothetical protein